MLINSFYLNYIYSCYLLFIYLFIYFISFYFCFLFTYRSFADFIGDNYCIVAHLEQLR